MLSKIDAPAAIRNIYHKACGIVQLSNFYFYVFFSIILLYLSSPSWQDTKKDPLCLSSNLFVVLAKIYFLAKPKRVNLLSKTLFSEYLFISPVSSKSSAIPFT